MKRFKNMRIRAKPALAFIVIALAALAVTMVGTNMPRTAVKSN